jgi:hypothetical protein
MSTNSYLRHPLLSSSLCGGSTLSTAGLSEHDLGPSGSPSDHPDRLHKSNRPEHRKPLVVSQVQKAGVNIVGHLSPRSRKGYTSLSLFGLVRPNLLLTLTRTQHKTRKLSSHLILLSVIKYLMTYLIMVILNCHVQFLCLKN